MPVETDTEVSWPTDEGIWMGWFQDCWFPFKTKWLLDDLSPNVGKPLIIVAQFIESEKSWPYTVKGCHPVDRWRKPTDRELERAKVFYGDSAEGELKAFETIATKFNPYEKPAE